jgi:hypothetical protein
MAVVVWLPSDRRTAASDGLGSVASESPAIGYCGLARRYSGRHVKTPAGLKHWGSDIVELYCHFSTYVCGVHRFNMSFTYFISLFNFFFILKLFYLWFSYAAQYFGLLALPNTSVHLHWSIRWFNYTAQYFGSVIQLNTLVELYCSIRWFSYAVQFVGSVMLLSALVLLCCLIFWFSYTVE